MTWLDTTSRRRLHYRTDDFTDPWRQAPAVLMLHGLAESARTWFAWVPTLARHFRLIRPDLPGFGESTPVSPGETWPVESVVDELVALLDHLGHAKVHVIGQRAGGAIAMLLALRYPERVERMVLVSAPLRLPQARGRDGQGSWREQLLAQGLEQHVRATMPARFGDAAPAQVEWWVSEMARTSIHSMLGAAAAVENLDLFPRLAEIHAPTLWVTSDRGSLVPIADIVAAQQRMRDARLMVLPRDSYHLAATEPDLCAHAALRFLLEAQQQGEAQ